MTALPDPGCGGPVAADRVPSQGPSRFTILIPCHNEAGSIRDVLLGVRAQCPDTEILVIDDGSTDGTGDIARAVPGVRVERLEPNRGKGVALREGFRMAGGEFVVMMDGDGQDDPAELRLLMDKAAEGFDFVNGSKFVGVLEPGAISRPNYWGNLFMSAMIRVFHGGRITDSQSGFRAVRTALARSMPLRSTQYEIETEMLCKALRARARIAEVPVTRRARTAGRTGFRRVQNGLRILWTIIAERFA